MKYIFRTFDISISNITLLITLEHEHAGRIFVNGYELWDFIFLDKLCMIYTMLTSVSAGIR